MFFYLKNAKAIWGGVLSIKCDRILCFLKERRRTYFCPTYINEGGVLSSIYGLDSIGRFITFGQLLLHLWSIIIFVPSTKLEEKVYRNCLDLRWFTTTGGYVHNMSWNDSGWISNYWCWFHLQIQPPSRLIEKRKGFLKHLRWQVRR